MEKFYINLYLSFASKFPLHLKFYFSLHDWILFCCFMYLIICLKNCKTGAKFLKLAVWLRGRLKKAKVICIQEWKDILFKEKVIEIQRECALFDR